VGQWNALWMFDVAEERKLTTEPQIIGGFVLA
jgi:hypothetical protein